MRGIATWGAVAVVSSLAAAQETDPMWDRHAWGGFEVGTWKRVRRFCETLDESGRVTASCTTETTTTLVEADQRSYTLRIDVVVEVAGKRFNSQPQFKRQGFHGQIDGQTVSIAKLGAGEVVINGEKIACEIQQVTVSDEQSKQVSKVYYCGQAYPFVLKRETTTTDLTGGTTTSSTSVDVIALEMPHRVLGEIRSVSHARIVHSHARGETITLEVHCADVPGGVVAHTSKELDKQRKVVARSTLELMDYGVTSGQMRPRLRLFQHFRWRPR